MALWTQLGEELKSIAPSYLKVLLPMLRLGFGGCRSFLLLVAWLCKSPFLVKYWTRYLGTRLFKHLKTTIHLCIFWKLDLTSLGTRKVSFELRGSVGTVALCNTLPKFLPTSHQHSQITAASVIVCETFHAFSCFYRTVTKLDRFLWQVYRRSRRCSILHSC